jgi:HSP20 family protein
MATLVRFREPFREVAALHNEMNRLMNGLLENGNGRSNQAWAPAADVWETEDELVYAFDLPGVSRDSIAVEFEDGALTITAERAPREVGDDRFYRFERRFGSFSRTIALPAGTTDDAISADYQDGVLEVRVRKPEQPKPRRIAIGGAAAGEPQTIEASQN